MFTLDVQLRSKVVAPDSTIIRELLNPRSPDVNITYSLAHGTILKENKTILHRLRSSSEAYFILAGTARFSVNEDAISEMADLQQFSLSPDVPIGQPPEDDLYNNIVYTGGALVFHTSTNHDSDRM